MHTLWIEHFQLKFSKWSNGLARCGMRFLNSPILKELIWPLIIESFKKYNHPHVHFLNPVKNANIFICAYSAFSNQPKPFLLSWGHGNDSEMAYKLYLINLRMYYQLFSRKAALYMLLVVTDSLTHYYSTGSEFIEMAITQTILLKVRPPNCAW